VERVTRDVQTGEETTSAIVLKPQEPGLDTNLLITTGRRAYYLRLVSKQQDYVARVAFSYPEEQNGKSGGNISSRSVRRHWKASGMRR
jgi:type IV secretory pathway VirB9-like protein